MKHLLFISFIIAALLTCARHDRISGTADDVNSGSLFGQLLTDDSTTIDDTVMVSLYDGDTSGGLAKVREGGKEPLRSLLSCDGAYEFDSLAAGTYRIEVTRDSIVIGEKRGIELDRNERKEVNITIVIIINQTFNIWTDQSQHITINNFYIDNGRIVKTDSGYVLSFAETDTLVFEIEIEMDGETSIVKVRIIRHSDGTTTFEIIDSEEGVDVTITSGTGPATGYLGDITIDIKDPGTVDIESTFDTSGVPTRSE
jgi:hypothetical protein